VFVTATVLLLGLPGLATAQSAESPSVAISPLSGSRVSLTQLLDTETPESAYQQLAVDARFSRPPWFVLGGVRLQNDGRYGEVQSGYWAGFNATVERGALRYAGQYLDATAGRYMPRDLVDSPYSLFVSAADNSAVGLELGLASESLFFSTRALQLNRFSALDFPDRGAVIRFYGMRRGPLRLGFQEATVYTGRVFDAQYFFTPVPSALLQPILNAGGRPWARQLNDNSIIGLFGDYTTSGWYAYGQLLVDDINMNRFLKPDSFQNPDKLAWSAGGSMELGWGRLGFYHAGATKYTFQAYGGGSGEDVTDTRYGYSYYPDVEYQVAGSTRVIPPSENYIGYLHGENNLAFMLSYSGAGPVRGSLLDSVNLSGSLELTLSGDKSPANPWHQYRNWREGGQGLRFLEANPLERRLTVQTALTATRGSWALDLELSGGYVWNELALTAVPEELRVDNNSIPYFTPSSESRPIAAVGVGISYALPATDSRGTLQDDSDE